MPSFASGFAEAYVRNALEAGVMVAILAACVGYFVILRGASFATHALSQIGFAGAAGAVFAGIEPLAGLIAFTLAGSFGLGALAQRSRSSDVTTALVLVFALGTGALFLALDRSYASDVFSLLFGTIVGVDRAQVGITAVAAVAALVLLGAVARPLLFATVSRDAAQAAGAPVALLDYAFLAILGLTTAVTVPVAGTLLVFSLTIGPAAAAVHLSARPGRTIALAAVLGTFAAVVGIMLAYETDWPVGFFISVIVMFEYLAARAAGRSRRGGGRGIVRENLVER